MSAPNPLAGFTVDRALLRYTGQDLQRPECILAERDGTLWAADARGGVTRIDTDGRQTFIGQRASGAFASASTASAEAFEAKYTQGTLPNGMAFAAPAVVVTTGTFGNGVIWVGDRSLPAGR